jgi:hypothetical protein
MVRNRTSKFTIWEWWLKMNGIIIEDISKQDKEYMTFKVQLQDKNIIIANCFSKDLFVDLKYCAKVEIQQKDKFYNIIELLEKSNVKMDSAKNLYDNREKSIELSMCFKLAVDKCGITNKEEIKRQTKELMTVLEELKAQ